MHILTVFVVWYFIIFLVWLSVSIIRFQDLYIAFGYSLWFPVTIVRSIIDGLFSAWHGVE